MSWTVLFAVVSLCLSACDDQVDILPSQAPDSMKLTVGTMAVADLLGGSQFPESYSRAEIGAVHAILVSEKGGWSKIRDTAPSFPWRLVLLTANAEEFLLWFDPRGCMSGGSWMTASKSRSGYFVKRFSPDHCRALMVALRIPETAWQSSR